MNNNKKQNSPQRQRKTLPAIPAAQGPAPTYIDKIPASILRQALLPLHPVSCPLQELFSTSEAVFEFIRSSDVQLPFKNACCQLEKQFDFYKNLIQLTKDQHP